MAILIASTCIAPLFAADGEEGKAPCQAGAGGDDCGTSAGDGTGAKPETAPCGDTGEKKSVFVNGQPFIVTSPSKPCPEN